jgi:hypothetical protein
MMFMQGNKANAAKLYVACGEALAKIRADTKDDAEFQQHITTMINQVVEKAEQCQGKKVPTEAEMIAARTALLKEQTAQPSGVTENPFGQSEKKETSASGFGSIMSGMSSLWPSSSGGSSAQA